jgi:mitofilin
LQQDAFGEGVGTSSLLDSYHLDDEAEKNTATEGLGEQVATFLSCAYFCD